MLTIADVRAVRLAAVALASLLVLLGAGCGTRVVVPGPDASAQETVDAFLDASRAGDRDAGHELTGDCWEDVSTWFANKHDRIKDFTVEDRLQVEPRPDATATRVRFRYSTQGGTAEGRWEAEVRRTQPAARWRVCALRPLAG